MTSRSPWPISCRIAGPPPRGRSSRARGAPRDRMATTVSSVAPRPIRSPCQATLSRPSRYRHRPAVQNGSPSSFPVVPVQRGPGLRQRRVGQVRTLAVEAEQPGHLDHAVVHPPPFLAPRHGVAQPFEQDVGACHPARPDVHPRAAVEHGPVHRRPERSRSRSSLRSSKDPCRPVSIRPGYDKSNMCSTWPSGRRPAPSTGGRPVGGPTPPSHFNSSLLEIRHDFNSVVIARK